MDEMVQTAGVFGVISPDDPDLREKILDIERFMLALPEDQKVELPERNHFAPGIYARELPIPKGTILVGKIHRYENMNIISKGLISVLTENGIKKLGAGDIIVSPPGTKRVGYAHEDTIWVTLHGTHETDVAKIEQEVLVSSFDELPAILDAEVLTLEG